MGEELLCMSLAPLAEQQHLVWVLVEKGQARIAVPYDMPSEDLLGSSSDVTLSVDPSETIHLVISFLDGHPGWAALVSILKGDAASQDVPRRLPSSRSRAASASEYSELKELGLDVPFGPWAQSESAMWWVIE